MKKGKMNILILLPKSYYTKIDALKKMWDKYFEVNYTVDVPGSLEKYTSKSFHLLFLWGKSEKLFEPSFYEKFQKKNPNFKYIVIKEEIQENDFEIYKHLADDILYCDGSKNALWKSLAILRRYWNTYSKATTIIYKDIIADFVDNKILVKNKMVELTRKETQLLKQFMLHIGKPMPKSYIFKKIWGYEEDTSRTLEQILFKLKKKIGKEYFKLVRKEGYKFE